MDDGKVEEQGRRREMQDCSARQLLEVRLAARVQETQHTYETLRIWAVKVYLEYETSIFTS